MDYKIYIGLICFFLWVVFIIYFVTCSKNEYIRKNTKLKYCAYKNEWYIELDKKTIIFSGTCDECKKQMYILGHDQFFYETNTKGLKRNIPFTEAI